MRKLSLVAVLLCSSVVYGQDAAKNDASKPAAETQTVKKPVVAEPRPLELHEQPTIVQMLQKNNEMRAMAGLGAHQISRELTQAAQDHANYMAATGSFSHYSNGGPQGRAAKFGHGGGVLENIAWGQQSVDQVFNTWRNSGGHWANMTSGTSIAGFGYQIGANGSPYWVAVYGHGAAAGAAVVVSQPATATTVTADSVPTLTTAPVTSTSSVPGNLPPGFLKPGEVIISSRIISEK